MHGCCSLVMAPTELERTQDMHTRQLDATVQNPRGGALYVGPALVLQPPGNAAIEFEVDHDACSWIYAHKESAH